MHFCNKCDNMYYIKISDENDNTLKYYSNYEKKRHNVKPGLTGLAQIKGRNSISWKKKFKYDIFYIDNLSFILDMRIFFMTIFKVIKKEGINSQYNMPVEPFNGHKN